MNSSGIFGQISLRSTPKLGSLRKNSKLERRFQGSPSGISLRCKEPKLRLVENCMSLRSREEDICDSLRGCRPLQSLIRTRFLRLTSDDVSCGAMASGVRWSTPRCPENLSTICWNITPRHTPQGSTKWLLAVGGMIWVFELAPRSRAADTIVSLRTECPQN